MKPTTAFETHPEAVTMATSAVVRNYMDGNDIDPTELTSQMLELSVANYDESILAHSQLLVAARASGTLATLHSDTLTGGPIKRTAAKLEIVLSWLSSSYSREAWRSGIPQNVAEMAISTIVIK